LRPCRPPAIAPAPPPPASDSPSASESASSHLPQLTRRMQKPIGVHRVGRVSYPPCRVSYPAHPTGDGPHFGGMRNRWPVFRVGYPERRVEHPPYPNTPSRSQSGCLLKMVSQALNGMRLRSVRFSFHCPRPHDFPTDPTMASGYEPQGVGNRGPGIWIRSKGAQRCRGCPQRRCAGSQVCRQAAPGCRRAAQLSGKPAQLFQ